MSVGYVEQMNDGRWCVQCGTSQQIDKYYLTSSDTLEGAFRILMNPDIPEDDRVPADLDQVTEIYVMKDFCFGERKKDFSACTLKKIQRADIESDISNKDDESYSLLFPAPFFVYHHEATGAQI